MGRLAEEAAPDVVVMTVEVTLLGAAATVADTEVEAEGTHPTKIAKRVHTTELVMLVDNEASIDYCRGFGVAAF